MVSTLRWLGLNATGSGRAWPVAFWDVKIPSSAWEGLWKAERKQEPVFVVFHEAPTMLQKELKALRLNARPK